jgi:sterol desaturase/sphingolipid hydroxylase (fatty acid hydroxylase superfamily)
MFVTAVVLAVAVAMMVVEYRWSGRHWPRVSGWWWRAILLNAVQVAAVWLAGIAWNGWMARHRFWSADSLGAPAGAAIGYLAITFVYYWWHRWRHELPVLWRWFHQVHHSPQRIEVITSFYKHPFEILVNSVLSSAGWATCFNAQRVIASIIRKVCIPSTIRICPYGTCCSARSEIQSRGNRAADLVIWANSVSSKCFVAST